jgi:Cyclic GMP-AMP synthase DncV-like, nucleotidyltransferase domain
MTTKDMYMRTVLEQLVELLDIPTSHYETATERYHSLGEWLHREQSMVAKFNPQVGAQGSFRYGTVVRPLFRFDEYDLDLVCELDIRKSVVTQKQIKTLIGTEIIAYAKAHGFSDPAEEKNRCWRLNYADHVKFHMDILPSVPEDQNFIALLQHLGVPYELAKLSVAITDKRHPNYTVIDPDWPRSNPKGFAGWFEGRMRKAAEDRIRGLVFKRVYASIDEVPPYEWKTPLQRSIQILKRHRDVMFKQSRDLAPISMILTTLAAHAYEGESDLYQACSNIVNKMADFVRPSKPRIPNPVNPEEDFADGWASDIRLEQNFWAWHTQIKADLRNCVELLGTQQLPDKIRKLFDVSLTSEQLNELTKIGAVDVSVAKTAAPLIRVNTAPKPWRRNG